MKIIRVLRLYRPLMKLLHRFDLHYAPPCYPDGDTHLWCQWCGFRQTIKRAELPLTFHPASFSMVYPAIGDKRA